MRSRGQQVTVKDDDVFEVLKQLPIFNLDGNLKKLTTDDVWTVAADFLSMKPITLYLRIYQNKNKSDLPDKLRIAHGFLEPSIKKNKNVPKVTVKEKDNYEETENFLELLTDPVYCAVIQKFGTKPFCVSYSFPEQNFFYSQSKELDKIFVMVLNKVLKEDKVANGKDISFYAFATETQNQIMPIVQCIIDDFSIHHFGTFVRDALRNNLKRPNEIFVGFSLILINEISNIFNECSLDDYNEMCLNSRPKVLIRVDKFEFLRVINEWESLKNEHFKKFFICCITYASDLDNFQLFEITIMNILMIFTSKNLTSVVQNKIDELKYIFKSNGVIAEYEKFLIMLKNKNISKTSSSSFSIEKPLVRKKIVFQS